MSNYVIITDSTSDLSQEIVNETGIIVVPVQFELDGLVYRNFPDERELSSIEFYKSMRSGKMPKTSQINANDFIEYFTPYLQEGNDILYLSFSSGLSGTFNSSRIAIETLQNDFPERKIIAVDTLAASGGEGLLAFYCAKKKKEGLTIDENARWVEDNKLNLCHWFTVDDLRHLKRGGRISATTAIVGSALQIKPVLHVDNEGHLINMEKSRGRKASIQALAEKITQRYTSEFAAYDTIMICNGDCREDAELLASLIKKNVKGIKRIIISSIGPVIGAHAGPGVLALFFFGCER